MPRKKQRGTLIVIDGIDGSGKATQAALLAKALKKKKVPVRTIDFPRYEDNHFGKLVGECLRGDHGDFVALDPKIASVLYAADRFETKDTIIKWLVEGYTVITDRYVSASQIHQGGKIRDTRQRTDFLLWLNTMEYDVFKIPRPQIVVFLDASPAISKQMLANKDQETKKTYLRGKKDVAEEDAVYLANSRKSAQWILAHEPNWHMVQCGAGGTIRSREDIHKEVLHIVSEHMHI